ncbi:PrgI family protein [Candidatus Parcubacteria bacterium]|nr:PrgI family protein [Candidatus Parcubacteria bacterium]
MQRFIVPQLIDVKEKILGPVTAHQFILMLAGGIIIFLAFRFGDIPFFIFISFIVAIIVFLFGFFKVNGAAFHDFLLNLLVSFRRPSLRVWNKELTDQELQQLIKEPAKTKIEKIERKEIASASRLAELSLIVDTHGKYKGE